MRKNHLWNRAKEVRIETGSDIVSGFDIGFDGKIPEQTKDELMQFVYWVEDHFSLPVTLWVDFKYNHYLIDRHGARVGYKFYWAELKNPFVNPDDVPVIELPVRTEHSTIEEILTSFVEAISLYYFWLTDSITDTAEPNAGEVEEILQLYYKTYH